jgi:peroxiredoxin family protein
MFQIQQSGLDPMVDGVTGVASFMSTATGAVVFI